MRVNGEWLACDDGAVRPVIRGEILAGDGAWRPIEMLVDTGADRTVLSAAVLAISQLAGSKSGGQIGGLGGIVDSVTVRAQLRLLRDDDGQAIFRGEFAACTQPESLDMSVLGRDILDLFAVVVERRTGTVAALWADHTFIVIKRAT